MNIVKKAIWTSVAAALMTVAAPAQEAHAAKKIPIIYQTGQDIFVAGDGSLPEPFAQEKELNGMQAGYMCDIFGLMGAYFTIDNCRPVAFVGDQYMDDKKLAAAIAAAHPEDSMEVGIWKKHGRIPVGLLAVGLLAFGAWSQLRGDDDEEEEAPAATPQQRY